jgi:hypothetical protein
MVRWIVIGAASVVAFTIYALVDLFMTNAPRVRAFPKPVWIAVVVALPVIGPLLWLFVGKSKPLSPKRSSGGRAPDDDPSFLGSLDTESAEGRIRRLEDELRKLDEEDTKDSPDEPETPPTKP